MMDPGRAPAVSVVDQEKWLPVLLKISLMTDDLNVSSAFNPKPSALNA